MKTIGYLTALLFFAPSLMAQQGSLQHEIEALKKDPALKGASWSVCVMNAKKDSVVYEYNSHLSLVPASTMKIMTTGAALSILGPSFMFETKLQHDGILDTATGTLKGNIYILGGGDPTLESEYFRDKKDSLTTVEKWSLLLREKGIKKIDGAIIADASIFEDNLTPSQWIWADMGNYFGAGACGLSYHDNKYIAYFKSGAAGTKTTLKAVQPQIEDLELVNYVTAGGNDDNAFIYGSQYSNYRVAQGTIPANKSNYEVEGSIPDPSLLCARALQKALENIDIKTTGKATTVRILKEKQEFKDSPRQQLHVHYSPSLEKIVYWTNMKSLNLYAEHLLKYIAYKKTGFGGNSQGTEQIIAFWKNKGVDISGYFMNDGSGLSRSNAISTKTQAQALKVLAGEKFFNSFYNSLPVAGRSGSLGGLCEGTCAENNLRAKSGYITRARSYAGFVKDKKSQMLCFSVIANNYQCSPGEMKKKLERILIAIAETQ
jgi:D-alanyl-D-alanine carboxypeptidase/D-alanyl-D-alanine-endopeptidase (penicillin-binding protein 4)